MRGIWAYLFRLEIQGETGGLRFEIEGERGGPDPAPPPCTLHRECGRKIFFTKALTNSPRTFQEPSRDLADIFYGIVGINFRIVERICFGKT